LRSTAARSFAVLFRQAGQAASAASMARRVSAAPMSGTRARRSPLAGLATSKAAPLSASHQAPPMRACVLYKARSLSFMLAAS
jgi:hypothetical protein